MDYINKLEKEIEELRNTLRKKEDELNKIKQEYVSSNNAINNEENNKNQVQNVESGDKLPKWAIVRYSRQILLSEIGVVGQQALCKSNALVVGAGALGCPALVYLAGAGIGEIGIIDYDTVEITNIHRQFLHTEDDQNISKVQSATNKLKSINSNIKITPYNVQLSSENALEIARNYDIILDCTDNVPTRYLLNDTCILLKKPLISGSALKMEGQLTIYGYIDDKSSNEKESVYRGPCYRCIFPAPPLPETVGSCSSNGVAGPVPGAIGALQALEAIKYIIGKPKEQLLVERMLIFDGDDITFRTVKLRPRNPNCAICSDSPTIKKLLDYEQFCNSKAQEKKPQTTHFREKEKEKRMSGKSYFGFRTTKIGEKTLTLQDVQKTERTIGSPCKCISTKNTQKNCQKFTEKIRMDIFDKFWNELDWREKKDYVRSLVLSVPVKRRRVNLKNEISRKGDSKRYNLFLNEEKYLVCRVMFLNTLGIKEAMVIYWLNNTQKQTQQKVPKKSQNVHKFISNLPTIQPKCSYCRNIDPKLKYINLPDVKTQYQLYKYYVQYNKDHNATAASRKTFATVLGMKNLRIFKPKSNGDICDLNVEHNVLPNFEFNSDLLNYDLKILPDTNRMSAVELSNVLSNENWQQRHLLVDVRSEPEFKMCSIEGSVNYPIEKLHGNVFNEFIDKVKCYDRVTLLCRRGNDSQIVAEKILNKLQKEELSKIKDLIGGLHAWAKNVDDSFPIY